MRSKNKLTKAEVIMMRGTVIGVCNYLRIRSLIDGVGQYMNKPYEYKSKEFKNMFLLMLAVGVGNYFGVSFNRTGIVADTIFPDFYFEYASRDRDFWLTDTGQLKKLIRKYRQTYRRRGGYRTGSDNDNIFYRALMGYHLDYTKKEYLKSKEEGQESDEFAFLKDYIWQSRKAEYDKYFDWPKVSHNHAKKIHRKKEECGKAKTWQSLRAFDNLCYKNNIVKSDRFIFICTMNSKSQDNKATIHLFDQALKREHIFIHAYANDMESETSIWSGLKDTLGVLDKYEKSDFKKGVITVPGFFDNPRPQDNPKYQKVVSGGGYVDGGWPLGDSIAAEVMAGEYIISTRAVKSIGKNNSTRGAEILTLLMRYFEASVDRWSEAKN